MWCLNDITCVKIIHSSPPTFKTSVHANECYQFWSQIHCHYLLYRTNWRRKIDFQENKKYHKGYTQTKWSDMLVFQIIKFSSFFFLYKNKFCNEHFSVPFNRCYTYFWLPKTFRILFLTQKQQQRNQNKNKRKMF